MSELEQILGLFVAAVILAAAARRAGAPYPVFLALGGALLAFLPGAPLLLAFLPGAPLLLAFLPGAPLFRRSSPACAGALRRELTARLTYEAAGPESSDLTHSTHSEIYRRALQAARKAVLAMRTNDEIGDDAFHRVEEELDWLEMAGGRKGE